MDANTEFKQGDKVIIKSDLVVDQWYGDDTFVEEMQPFLGKTVTIHKKVKWLDYPAYYIKEEENGDNYNWTPEMFERKVE